MQSSYTEGGETVAGTLLAETERKGPSAQLLVYAGSGSESGGQGRVVELPDGATVTFGRSRGATVMLDSEKVSRQHARLERKGDTFTITDLGSRNGTVVNGQPITAPTELGSGDAITIGDAVAVLSVARPLSRRPVLGGTEYLDERLEAECDRGTRYRRPFALAIAILDGTDDEVDALVERIAGATRAMDVIAEYSPSELALIFPEATEPALSRTLADIAAMSDDAATASLGAALFPDHGTVPGELISAARGAARQARQKSRGSSQVAASRNRARASETIIVEDPKMQRVFELASRVADSKITVLIHGETGSGKEVVAEAIHQRSERATRPYIRINCAALTETLLESELFGHERGAFTGADQRKIGYFEACDGGTLFLDEIGEMPLPLQTKLLRVLEEHRFTRVGGTAEVDVDVRVVCATNRDLATEVKEHRFREDLYFRVSAFTIAVPPLRERSSEILPLARTFLQASAEHLGGTPPELSPQVERLLEAYPWPGNVRELRNAMERAVVLGDSTISIEHLPERLREPQRVAAGVTAPIEPGSDIRETIADVERQSIVAALDGCGGNQTQAAKKLGISRRSLIYKMEKHGLKKPPKSQR